MSEYDVSISGCILARNEEGRIEDALRSLQGWTDQIIVIDNESEDGTVAVARRYTDCILSAPQVPDFDCLRNLAIDAATGAWLFYLDADERVPARLGAVLRGFVRERGDEFEALCIPFKHYFCGKWMQHSGWWPGYTRPQLLKKGCFRYNERVHSGVAVEGRTLLLPADDPELAITHYSFDDMRQYPEKLNRYTDGEAEGLYAGAAVHSWRAQLAHFVQDWRFYYERGRADLDGMHGFVLAFMSGFYRFLARAKLWDLRRQRGELLRPEPVPADLRQILEFMTRVAQEGTEPWLSGSYPRIRTTGKAIPDEWAAPQSVVSSAEGTDSEERSGITACVFARNEEGKIEAALRSLQGWTDRIIVVDNGSHDRTPEIAWRYADVVLAAPPGPHLEAVRAQMADAIAEEGFIAGEWIFFLDADERVSPQLGATLRRLVREHGDEFDALCVPFRNHFYGQWMQSGVWWPAYKGPQLLKKGAFQFDSRIHSGFQVQGRLCHLGGDDPACAVDHYAYDNLHQYLEKLDRYTEAEAGVLDEAGASHSWQAHLADLVQDWQIHYEYGRADRDGMHGFVQSLLCAFYRFAARAKLWDLRQRRGDTGREEAVPAHLGEMLGFMSRVAREGAERWLDGAGVPDANRDQERWAKIYDRVSLADTPSHYRAFTSMPFLSCLLETVRGLCPPGGRVLETGIGFGYGSIWLSQHGLLAHGIDYSPAIVERAARVNELLGGQAAFRLGDFFDLSGCTSGVYDVIFHQGVLEHFSDEEIRSALLAQVSLARHVVFSVPSVHYPYEREFGNERLLSLEQWRSILEGFAVDHLTYYGDPKLGAREQILAVVRGALAGDSGAPAPEAAGAEAVDETRRSEGFATGSPAPRVPLSPAQRVPLLWRAPLFDRSGFADESRNFVMGLIGAGETVAVAPEQWEHEAELEPEERALLTERIVPADTPAELCVLHTLLSRQRRSPNGCFNIARAMFETDRLPPGAAHALNAMDRIWVPSEFNRQTFTRSGVEPEKIAVVPGALDARRFADEAVLPWLLPGGEAYRFLSVFDWTLHKGWDVLLEAFAAEFGGEPDAGLVLKVWSSQRYTLEEMQAQADSHLRKSMGQGLAAFPNIHFWSESLSVRDLPRIYRSAAAFVLPTRGEGWGRPLMEAMASGLPTIATAWSGLTEFHHAGVGYPLKYQLVPVPAGAATEVPVYGGHYWAEPDVADLRRLMRQLVADPEAARERGLAAKEAIAERYSRCAVAELLHRELARCREMAGRPAQGPRRAAGPPAGGPAGVLEPPPFRPAANLVVRDPVPPVSFQARLGRAVRIRWEGDQSLLSSLARVNREFCLGLLAAGDVELTLDEPRDAWHTMTERDDPRLGRLFARRGAELSGPADVTVRQYFPPDWRRPSGGNQAEGGKFVVIQPWEYGHLPCEWVTGAREQADEVWVHSRFVRDLYVRSGVPAEKIRIIPLGFDPEIFGPDGPAGPLPTQRSLRFLFVGGAIHRKGADLLLAAYQRAFTAKDDVCLVVKDMGTRTFYQGMTYRDLFRRAQADPRSPEVLYLDADLSDPELAALYRACACVVLPYRAEGFALPPLEGMGCGLPAIVTSGGPTDDYLDDTMALRVPHRRRLTGGHRLGDLTCAGDPWHLEPDPDALVDALRWVRDHPEGARERGARARAHAAAHWTWSGAVASARERLSEIAVPAPATAPAAAALWAEPLRVPDKVPAVESGAPEISLCVIARDEECRIGSCLDSIAPFVNEMVVVDTGSSDGTREVAQQRGARVFDFPWVDCFATARNESLRQARGQWIFWMDADDTISPECGRRLRELVRRYPKRDAAFQVQVRIPPGPGEFSESVVDHIKLFPNRPDLRFEHRIHEQILPSLRRAGLTVLPSDLYVTHQNYDRSAEGQQKKRRRDFRLLELDLRDRPDNPFVLFNLGMTHLLATRDYEIAVHYLRRCLRGSDWRDSIVRKAYAFLTTAHMGQEDWAAALEANREGRRYYPDDAELLFQAGRVYAHLQRWGEAQGALERLIEGKDDEHFRSVDMGLRTYRGRHEMALLLRRRGDAGRAAQLLREIAAAYPDYLPAQLDFVETLGLMGELEQARRLLDGIPGVSAVEGHVAHLRRFLDERARA